MWSKLTQEKLCKNNINMLKLVKKYHDVKKYLL